METGRGNNYHKVIIMLHIIRKKHTNFIKVFNYYHIHLAKKKKKTILIYSGKRVKSLVLLTIMILHRKFFFIF